MTELELDILQVAYDEALTRKAESLIDVETLRIYGGLAWITIYTDGVAEWYGYLIEHWTRWEQHQERVCQLFEQMLRETELADVGQETDLQEELTYWLAQLIMWRQVKTGVLGRFEPTSDEIRRWLDTRRRLVPREVPAGQMTLFGG